MVTEKDIGRFWSHVKKLDSGCWEWQLSKVDDGYGRVRINKFGWLAHRFSWVICNGKIPAKLCVLHKCDNPPCVNPSHLFTGTKKENNVDRDKKGRGVYLKGQDHNKTILTDEMVLEIRRLYRVSKKTQKQVGEIYGIAQSTVSKILLRQAWRHI